jgi:aspergillopepsin I
MYGLPQIALALAALQVFTMAAAISLEKGRHFSVTQIYNSKFMLNGPIAYAKAFNKFNKPMPYDLAAATGKEGRVTATPSNLFDEEYLCPVDIGGQTLHLVPDTGLADLCVSFNLSTPLYQRSLTYQFRWVFSTSLLPCQQNGHTLFDPLKSKTFRVLNGYKWDILYGDDSSASGTVGTDIVTVGGTSVSGQAVEIAMNVSSSFVSNVYDGVLGLAFSSINRGMTTASRTMSYQADISDSDTKSSANLLRDGGHKPQHPCLHR